jgi:8-oxo-dGTP pyrophosphatase MutT (NUDIX family)
MWLITKFGFFSIVEKPEDKAEGTLTVRSRVLADLEALRECYLPSMGEISAFSGTDYQYRAQVTREALGVAMLKMAMDIDYSNFKNEVYKKQGSKRSGLYGKVWGVLHQLKAFKVNKDGSQTAGTLYQPETSANGGKTAANTSYGGVLFDGEGRVLLRKPADEYDGYVWTFAKGRPDAGMSPEQTAIREVREETGYSARILGRVPGVFQGGTGFNQYFVMQPMGIRQPFSPAETDEVCWVKIEEVAVYIGQTRNSIGRKRDLEVLKQATAVFRSLNS